MMLEQQLWAHSRIGDLHAQSANSETPEVIVAYTLAAARLMAEFRKSALALREYRSPVVPKQVVLDNQDAAAGDTEAANAASHNGASKQDPDSELRSNETETNHVSNRLAVPTTDRWSPEPHEAQGINGERSPDAERNGHGEYALAALNGATNGRG
jgi:hypothetical protein